MKAERKNLFEFQWAVDQDGYEIEKVPPGSGSTLVYSYPGYRQIRRRGGPWRHYRPVEEDPGIARRFACLPETPDAVLQFVNRYGLPGTSALRTSEPDPWSEFEPLEDLYRGIRNLRFLFDLIDADKRQQVLELFNQHLKPRMTIRIGGGGTRKPHLEVAPLSLNSFMVLQLAEEITRKNVRYVLCENCPSWFLHRRHKRFCSNTCRVAAHRKKGLENKQ